MADWHADLPLVGDGLWEIRSDINSGRIARVLFGLHENKLILLHGFIKKSQKTPIAELNLARRRWKEVTR